MECAHASAIGMVFSANLLVMGWASVYRLLGTQAAEERFEQTIIQRLHLLERQITRNDKTD